MGVAATEYRGLSGKEEERTVTGGEEEEDGATTRASKCAWFPSKENNDDGQKDNIEETADRVGRRWASSTESQEAGRYSSFRKEFNGFGPRSTLPFGQLLSAKAHPILSWRGGKIGMCQGLPKALENKYLEWASPMEAHKR